MYSDSPSKTMRTSVGSVAGRPFCGSCWMKFVAGTALDQNGSSSRPSSTTRSSPARRTAVTLRRPPLSAAVCCAMAGVMTTSHTPIAQTNRRGLRFMRGSNLEPIGIQDFRRQALVERGEPFEQRVVQPVVVVDDIQVVAGRHDPAEA